MIIIKTYNSGKIDWPRHIDPVAKDLIKKFLVQVIGIDIFGIINKVIIIIAFIIIIMIIMTEGSHQASW